MERIFSKVRRALVGPEESVARRWQRRLADAGARDRIAFARALRLGPGKDQLVLASLVSPAGTETVLGLPLSRALSFHAAVAGGTGTGKTRWLLNVLAQVLQQESTAVVVVDAKGETADLVLEQLLPFLIDSSGDDRVLEQLRVLRVFDPAYVPLLNVTMREGAAPKEAQAFSVAAAVEQALAEPLGGRMHHVLVRLVCVCIEQQAPLYRVSEWLTRPHAFVRAALQSPDEATREYARSGYPQENKESLRALAARLNALLVWPGAREALCAPGAVSFADALAKPGLTVVSTGSPPAGAERLARFFGGLLIGKLTRAILTRRITPESPPALVVAEEIQEMLGAEEARQFGRLLAIARSRKTALWTTNQSRSQLSAVDPALVAAMRANVGLQLQFRSSPEDAVAFAHALPDSGKGHERRALIHELTRLPQRQCYLAVRDLGIPAQRVVTPLVETTPWQAAAERLSPERRRRIDQGIAALPRLAVPEEGGSKDYPTPTTNIVPPEDGPFPALG